MSSISVLKPPPPHPLILSGPGAFSGSDWSLSLPDSTYQGLRLSTGLLYGLRAAL